ncbi:MAG: hypothetical protein LBR08_01180 [Bacteroidales bacterium]|nr:hypothetical protein [Bacteroidales bacterium]
MTVMLVALYLLYRIAYPGSSGRKQGDDSPQTGKRESGTVADVIGKSRPVSGFRRQPAPTPATLENPAGKPKKPDIFAVEIPGTNTAIPSEALDEVFAQPPEPIAIDYPPERIKEEPEDEAAGE